VRQVLTGRIADGPSDLVNREVLEPQFRYEAEHLLGWYVLVEKVLLLEYRRMGLLTGPEVGLIGAQLDNVTPASVTPDRDANLSDIAFAVERFVAGQAEVPVAWHVDRSRNDLQACAQLMFGRAELAGCAQTLIACAKTAVQAAARGLAYPMPGYTHLQAAQVVTPGFFLAAMSGHLLHTLRRLLATYDGINLCPLGAGAMAGQELDWDRDLMASLLGFAHLHPHALAAVASRAWALEVAGELATFGTGLSRFITDLMTWGGSATGFIDFPDELAGISSAMPQKRNFPILERIRGKTAHLFSAYVDVTVAQRGTSFSNSVEVGKESCAGLANMFTATRSAILLTDAALSGMTFQADRMRESCADSYLDGFSLANRLTLSRDIPWRTAQVIAGKYITAAIKDGTHPGQADPGGLRQAGRDSGWEIDDPDELLRDAFDPDQSLLRKRSAGSANPDRMRLLLTEQEAQLGSLTAEWERRTEILDSFPARVDRLVRTCE
jgi:argininosuccinate lyase